MDATLGDLLERVDRGATAKTDKWPPDYKKSTVWFRIKHGGPCQICEPATSNSDGPVYRAKAPANGHDRPLSITGIPRVRGILHFAGQLPWSPLTLENAPSVIRVSKCQRPKGSNNSILLVAHGGMRRASQTGSTATSI